MTLRTKADDLNWILEKGLVLVYDLAKSRYFVVEKFPLVSHSPGNGP